MIKWWRLFVNRQIVKVIQAAMNDDFYDKSKYLCNTIERTSSSMWGKVAINRIEGLIDKQVTLYGHIMEVLSEAGWGWEDYRSYTLLNWAEQKTVHVKFWNLAITALLNGHGNEPLRFTPDQLGLAKYPKVDKPQPKMYEGPFGSYKAGSAGAVLNALCEQEGRSCGIVGDYVIGNGKLFANHHRKEPIATFEWNGDDITFTWKTA